MAAAVGLPPGSLVASASGIPARIASALVNPTGTSGVGLTGQAAALYSAVAAAEGNRTAPKRVRVAKSVSSDSTPACRLAQRVILGVAGVGGSASTMPSSSASSPS